MYKLKHLVSWICSKDIHYIQNIKPLDRQRALESSLFFQMSSKSRSAEHWTSERLVRCLNCTENSRHFETRDQTFKEERRRKAELISYSIWQWKRYSPWMQNSLHEPMLSSSMWDEITLDFDLWDSENKEIWYIIWPQLFGSSLVAWVMIRSLKAQCCSDKVISR